MEEKILSCPLCCGKTFDSKQAMVQHLSNYAKTFQCPLCSSNFSSVPLLLEHLSQTDCSAQENELPIVSAIDRHSIIHNRHNETISKSESGSNDANLNLTNDDFHDNVAEDDDMSELPEESLEANKMYQELIEKYEDKQFPGADMQLLEENGHSRYTIVAHNGAPAIMSSGTVITKQNSDGTISITTAKDDIMTGTNMKMEPEPVITVTEKDPEGDGDEGIYSCNMCGVSFFSVLEHIQKYHKDQDVVVEVNEQNGTDNSHTIEFVTEEDTTKDATDPDPFEFVSIITQETKVSTQENSLESGDMPPRRVITDTGDIVETSARNKTLVIEVPSPTIPMKNIPLASLEEDVVDKKGRVFRRKLVHLDKMNVTDTEADSATKTPPKQPYHQVVVKEIVTMDGNKKMKVYNCIACHIYVTELEEFKSHPCKSLKYSCAHCPVSYENAKSLCAHMKAHKASKHQSITKLPPTGSVSVKKEDSAETVATAGPYKCDICSTVFPTNKSLKLHKRMHDPVKPRAIEPPYQEETTEDNPEKYFCTVCLKWIPIGYKDVHDNFHDSPDNFNCEICNKKFESSNYLAMHMSVHNMDKTFAVKKHDKSLPYTCLYCNRQFARPHEKVKHERIHTGEKPHTCEICGKAFRVSYCLTLHMRTHTGARPYACNHCGKRFKAHSVYNHHLLTHSDVRAYKCPYCPKAFKTSVQLAGHKNSHTKPFSCEHCNRPFASLYAVRVHQETHRRQNNLKFSCSLCGASYARSFALKDHVKQAHGNEVDNPDSFVIHIDKETWEVGDSEQLDSKEKMDTEITKLEKSPNEEAVMCV